MKKDGVDANIFFGQCTHTISPLAKENNSMAKASSMPCKTTRHPLSSNKSLAIEKSYS